LLCSCDLWKQILSMSEGERVTSIVPVSEFAEDRYLLMLTVNGCIKKVSLKLFSGIRSTGIIAIQLVCPLFLLSHIGSLLNKVTLTKLFVFRILVMN